MAVGTGQVLTRADYAPGSDESLKLEGNVLGGGDCSGNTQVGLGSETAIPSRQDRSIDGNGNQSTILFL